MPGFIPHFIAGNAIFLLGHFAIQQYTDLKLTAKDTIFFYGICIFFSIIPDFALGLYYVFHLKSYNFHANYHNFIHMIISPLSVILFISLGYFNVIKKKPIWLFAIFCIILHIIMDATIQETGIWI